MHKRLKKKKTPQHETVNFGYLEPLFILHVFLSHMILLSLDWKVVVLFFFPLKKYDNTVPSCVKGKNKPLDLCKYRGNGPPRKGCEVLLEEGRGSCLKSRNRAFQ